MSKFFFSGPKKPENRNEPIIRGVKTIAAEGDINMGVNSGQKIKHEDTNQQPDKPLAQAGWGVSKPIIEYCGKITSKGDINLGTDSGSTILKKAPKG